MSISSRKKVKIFGFSKSGYFKHKNKMQRNCNNNLDIVSTNASYIPATHDSYNNHLHLSIAIHNKIKKIVAWNFGKSNDNNLVFETIYKLPKFSDWIIHSDHGVQYSSYEYRNLIKELNGQISMSRVGNSLDNREEEYFFSNIKSECLNFLNYSKLNFEELKTIIADYINWYNNECFQSVIKWKTPPRILGGAANEATKSGLL